ncbi:hypothetical protein KI688_008007 [Linnemannia hyalina]|uniref:Kazal-like domain-containing protein n=1 Tax=Linnemannia hyalina TaxID=64524 RepID=A0A9P7Y370_9FUNG|nr:hypothetical protein KI688_008007 [Linnemannia hyalina]
MQFSKLISFSAVATLLMYSSSVQAAPMVCNKACTFIYQPVCAQLKSGEKQTFGNACTLGVYNCQHPHAKAKVLAQSACEEMYPTCDIMCAMVEDPVCATSKDGKTRQTFGNSCLLRVHNCQNPDNLFSVVSETACEVEEDEGADTAVVPAPEKRSTPMLPVCDIICTMEYAPVCTASKNGKHFQTFSNKCALSVFNCQNPDNSFTIVSDEACETDATETAAPEKRSTPLLPVCDIVCTMEYAPVCTASKNGKHFQTFSNKCALSVFNCQNPDNSFTIVSDEACETGAAAVTVPEKRSTPLLPTCDIVCTMEYAPVCTASKNGNHYQTFSNKCALSVFNCQNPDNTFHVVAHELCPIDSDAFSPDAPAPAAVEASADAADGAIDDLAIEDNDFNKCGTMCTMVVDPVCAKDKRGQMRRFNNLCLLTQYTCAHPTAGLEFVDDKSCFLQ